MELLSEPTLLDWIWNLGGGNVVIHIVIQIVICLALCVAVVFLVNFLGTHMFGYDGHIIPAGWIPEFVSIFPQLKGNIFVTK